jgi:hypothetical protein
MSIQAAFTIVMAALVLSVYAGLFIGRCIRWCDDEGWRNPIDGDCFSDGKE